MILESNKNYAVTKEGLHQLVIAGEEGSEATLYISQDGLPFQPIHTYTQQSPPEQINLLFSCLKIEGMRIRVSID
ncbi:hypothetical protein [Enterovibrio norvegicus]|uniref:hypothetical protein n=1 Tax=Enterovibrio norvegicus TaxID=188144 RepID=UPI000C853742|nr:hypothetical protein [Enterovibrio norvegicus]PMN73185.1 hypothetical protein BCT27_12650 [Enterovibrio norvegicus]